MGVVIAILYLGRLFFITSLIALTIAFILEPFVALLMRIRFPRSLASFVVCSFALALLYVIGLGAYSQLAGLYDELPKYGQRIGDLVDGIQQKITVHGRPDVQGGGAGAPAAGRGAPEAAGAGAGGGQEGQEGDAAPVQQTTPPRRGRSPRSGFTKRARPLATTSIRA